MSENLRGDFFDSHCRCMLRFIWYEVIEDSKYEDSIVLCAIYVADNEREDCWVLINYASAVSIGCEQLCRSDTIIVIILAQHAVWKAQQGVEKLTATYG